ncbi:protein YaaA [Vibrio sp. JCM 19236]|nr:protein YaaA [Vibrio sp. JCM 19236]
MLVIVSPAKTLDFESPLATERYTQPDFILNQPSLLRYVVN